MFPASAPQSRAAVSITVSSTGCTSAVERLMTLSTSLVAVWYSSDSSRSRVRACSSPSSRAFSIAMTACAAKFWRSAICLSVNGLISVRYTVKAPSNALSLRKAMQAKLRAAPNSTSARAGRPGNVVRFLAQVRRPNNGLARHDPLGDGAGPRFKQLALADDLYQRGRRAAQGHDRERLSVIGLHDPESGVAKSNRVIEHGVEDRREIAGRGID